MRFAVAHLNRPLSDGRVLTHLDIGEPPWPVLSPEVGRIGVVHSAEVVNGVVYVELDTFSDVDGGRVFDIDWTLFRPFLDLRDVTVHSIGAEIRMSGALAAVTVLPREGFPVRATDAREIRHVDDLTEARVFTDAELRARDERIIRATADQLTLDLAPGIPAVWFDHIIAAAEADQ